MATQEIPKVQVQVRDRVGSRYAARLRKEGRLPAIIYGHKKDNLPVWVDYRQFVRLLHDNVHLIEAVVDSRSEPCLIRDVQWNHLGTAVVHVDLARVDLSELVEVEVELELVGQSDNKALQQAGAVLVHPVSSIEVKCRADQIPDRITVDLSGLELDQTLTVGDLQLPEGVQAVTDAETVIAQIQIVQETPEEVAAAEAGAAEPEVIGRGAEKKEEAQEQ